MFLPVTGCDPCYPYCIYTTMQFDDITPDITGAKELYDKAMVPTLTVVLRTYTVDVD